MKKEFAVIGLGRFGGSICKALSEEGLEVMAIDRDEDRVNEYAKIATHAVIGDTTDASVVSPITACVAILAYSFTRSSSLSIAITSSPSSLNALQMLPPNRPSPITANSFFIGNSSMGQS